MSEKQKATPETDAAALQVNLCDADCPYAKLVEMVHPATCRRLERERDDLLNRLTVLELRMPEELARLERERNEARDAADYYRLKVVAFGATQGWTFPQPLPWDKEPQPSATDQPQGNLRPESQA